MASILSTAPLSTRRHHIRTLHPLFPALSGKSPGLLRVGTVFQHCRCLHETKVVRFRHRARVVWQRRGNLLRRHVSNAERGSADNLVYFAERVEGNQAPNEPDGSDSAVYTTPTQSVETSEPGSSADVALTTPAQPNNDRLTAAIANGPVIVSSFVPFRPSLRRPAIVAQPKASPPVEATARGESIPP